MTGSRVDPAITLRDDVAKRRFKPGAPDLGRSRRLGRIDEALTEDAAETVYTAFGGTMLAGGCA
jgi:hypothetical protein